MITYSCGEAHSYITFWDSSLRRVTAPDIEIMSFNIEERILEGTQSYIMFWHNSLRRVTSKIATDI
ncbi:hypothetical protein J6590_074757 [Homalodisca vitripennis]|nr:hypothetical protein J6590_074757 [Homalodisca vitripennis]